MKIHNYILASITVAVMILFCSCAVNQLSDAIEEPSQTETEEDEFMKIAKEKTAFSDFFFENQSTFERVVSCLSAQHAPNEKMVYFGFDEENGPFWSDGLEIEPFVDQQLQNECENLMAAGYRFDAISYTENVAGLGKRYAFVKRLYDRDGWPLCDIIIHHFDLAEAADPNKYEELDQLADKWWISAAYYDGPCLQIKHNTANTGDGSKSLKKSPF